MRCYADGTVKSCPCVSQPKETTYGEGRFKECVCRCGKKCCECDKKEEEDYDD